MPWSAASMAYSPIRPKSQISNVGHDGTLSFRNFILMLKELKNPIILGPLEANGALAHTSYHPASGIRQKHDCTLSNRNFILKMKKPKNLGFESVHPKMCSLLRGTRNFLFIMFCFRKFQSI
jgi:hypothetical protein